MPRFHVAELRPLGTSIMRAAGATAEEADLIIDHALAALLSGEGNHGMELGTQYIDSIESGLLKPGTEIEILRQTETTLLVDGGMNFGHYVSHHTMLRLIDMAKEHHVAAGSIRYQGHVGRLIDYTAMAAEAGMIALMVVDGAWGPKFVAPYGGLDRRLGNNPFSMTVPSKTGGTVGFDMTTSAGSFMKIMRARDLGEPIPEGWIIDKYGRDTTDPNDFWEGGSVLPIGGPLAHKGYVLSFIIEVLADVLSGMEFREEPDRPWPAVDGCFMALFDVEAFRPLEDFKDDLADMTAYIKSSSPAEGSAGVFYPGERSHLTARKRAVDGVVIPDTVWREIVEQAAKYGLLDSVPAATWLEGENEFSLGEIEAGPLDETSDGGHRNRLGF